MHHDDTAEIIGTLMTFSPFGVFANAVFLVKLAIILIVGAGAVALIAAIARRASHGARSGLLAVMGRIGLYFGIGGAAYTAVDTFLTVRAMHVTRFVVYEPEVLEVTYVLLLGVIVFLIARFGNAGAKRTYTNGQ